MAWDFPGRALRQWARRGWDWISRPPFRLVRVRGASMQPTLADGQYVLTRPADAGRRELRRGDLIVFHPPDRPERLYIKRIIAGPEEYLELTAAETRIDGVPCPELDGGGPAAGGREYARRWHTGPGEYFVLGDNRAAGGDSRRFGPVDRSLIVGRVCWFRRRGRRQQ